MVLRQVHFAMYAIAMPMMVDSYISIANLLLIIIHSEVYKYTHRKTNKWYYISMHIMHYYINNLVKR